MKRTVSLGLCLIGLWLLLSGHYNALLISLGVVSVILTLIISRRMELIDAQSHPIHLTFKLIGFWLRLFVKIVQSNIDVSLRILGLRKVEPQLIKVKLDQPSDLSKVIYANAITLTPGSASLHIEGDELYVHTISAQGAQDLLEGDMAKIIPIHEETERTEKKQ